MGMQVAAEDWIAHHARFSPHRDAIHDLASGRRSTYRTLDERVSRAACFYHNILGVRAGERIAVLCHNDSDAFEIQFACQRIGAILPPVNWRLALPELEFIGNDATPRVFAYLFTGTLLTLEPLAFSPPGHRGADHRALLPRMPVPSAAGPVDTVYLAGSTLRGAYRHACAEVWLEREGTVTLQRFLELTVGGVKGSGEEPRVGLRSRRWTAGPESVPWHRNGTD